MQNTKSTQPDSDSAKLSNRQLTRLANITHVSMAEIKDMSLADLRKKPELDIEHSLLLTRRITGRVVKKDADGNNLPVPFATVDVYDTDITGAFWSPSNGPHSWFYPLRIRREKLASVVTDQCGNFYVRVPKFDIDAMLRWRLERRCYLEWLRKPTIRDILEYYKVIPQLSVDPRPDPGPDPRRVRIDEEFVRHAGPLLDAEQTARLRELAMNVTPGISTAAADALLDAPRWSAHMPPPLPLELRGNLTKSRASVTALTGIPDKYAAALDPKRVFGPFLRCHGHMFPEWHLIFDIPDLTFEVKQDVDGDGVQEIIYSEGLFDVRWNASGLSNVELVAGPNARATVSCENPSLGPCGEPALLLAGNYALQQPGNPSNGHDRVSGYATFPNVPRLGGNPTGARIEPGEAPFRSNFYLWGCCERPGANRYRIRYTFTPIAGGPAVNGVLGGASWTLAKLVSGVVQYFPISDIGGWYPIVPRADGWSPSGLLALVPAGLATGRYDFVMEFGNLVGGTVTPIAGSATQPYAIMIDNSVPTNPGITQIDWRLISSNSWTPLPLGACPVIERGGTEAIQVRVSFSTAAHHLRDVTLSAAGCGATAAPTFHSASGMPDTYYVTGTSTIQHWHSTPSDNSTSGYVSYNLAAGAPAGCYSFTFTAVSRAIDPNQPGNNTANNMWHTDPTVLYSHQILSVAVQ